MTLPCEQPNDSTSPRDVPTTLESAPRNHTQLIQGLVYAMINWQERGQ